MMTFSYIQSVEDRLSMCTLKSVGSMLIMSCQNSSRLSLVRCEENLWRERIVNDDDFQLFRSIHPNIKPHKAWAVAKSFPEFRSDTKYVVDLCNMVRYDNRQSLCDKCGILYQNIIEQETNEMNCHETREEKTKENNW
jgi:hypothetical protein